MVYSTKYLKQQMIKIGAELAARESRIGSQMEVERLLTEGISNMALYDNFCNKEEA